MDPIGIALIMALVVPILLLIFFVYQYQANVKNIEYDQHLITDKELLETIAQQPGGIVSVKQLTEITPLTKQQARFRLMYFQGQGLLKQSHDTGFKAHYSLAAPIDERPTPPLSDKPFLTVEDILTLFKHHNHQITLQKICMDTGLPIVVIKREIKYFMKEKIVKMLYTYGADGMTTSKTYILEEPYRSDPDIFLEKQEAIDFELEELLEEDIVRVRK